MRRMTRTSLLACIAILALGTSLVACGDGGTGAVDSGPPDTGVVAVDAGTDSGTGGLDSGIDAGAAPVDAGVDAFMRDGSILPPIDSGDPFGDAGTLGPPEWVPLDVLTDGTTCDPLVPCGGDVVGTWDVTGGCIEAPIPSELMSCPGATVTGSGRARGRVVFDGAIAHRLAQSEVTVEVFVPSLCASFVGGCAGIEDMLQMQVPDSACVMETAGCVCAARQTLTIDDGDAYTIEGNEIVSSTGKRWAYCIDTTSGGMRYEDTSPTGTGPQEEGIIELGMR